MARFMAVHTMPMTEEQAMAMVKNMPPLPKGVSWKYTWADFKGGKFFCEWEAPNKETLEENFQIDEDAVRCSLSGTAVQRYQEEV